VPHVPVPGLSWTVGECAAHVVSLYRRLTTDRRPPSTVLELSAKLGPDYRDTFHAGMQVSYPQGTVVVIGELVVHGDDIARATGAPWHPLPADVLPVWRLAVPLMSGWLRPEAPAGRQLS